MTTTYYMEGNQVSWQTDGTNTIHYVYDTDGNLVYMLLNGTIYYYERNAQGDIIGLVDSSMNEVVTYSYDTWGKLIDIGGSMADTVGVENPFRYRGYMYDTETGLYYLQSRYYDSNTGRMINSDGAVSTGTGLLGHNMFAYCNNNPVMMSDDGGSRPIVGGVGAQETAAERAASFAAMYPVGHKLTSGHSSTTSSVGLAGTVANASKYIAEGAADKIAADTIRKLPDVKYGVERVGSGIGMPLRYADKLESVAALKCISKVGIVSGAALCVDIGSDVHDYVGWDLAGAITIDATGLGLGVLAGVGIAAFIATAPFTIPVAIGVGSTIAAGVIISMVGDSIKNTYLKKRR